MRAGLLLGSTLTYLATQNLWMTIILNLVLEWALLPQTQAGPQPRLSRRQAGDHHDAVRINLVRITGNEREHGRAVPSITLTSR